MNVTKLPEQKLNKLLYNYLQKNEIIWSEILDRIQYFINNFLKDKNEELSLSPFLLIINFSYNELLSQNYGNYYNKKGNLILTNKKFFFSCRKYIKFFNIRACIIFKYIKRCYFSYY